MEEQIGRGKENYDKSCKLCGKEDEDMVHFIVKCEKLEEARSGDLLDRGTRDPEEVMRILLFRDERGQEIGRMIRNLWESRKKQLKEKGENTADRNPQGVGVTTHRYIGNKRRGEMRVSKKIRTEATQGCNQNPKSTPLTTQGCRQSERIRNLYKKEKNIR